MVTAMELPPSAGSAVGSALGVLVLVVIAGWALMFAVMFGLLIYLTVLRGRRQRRKRVEPGPAVPADPNLPAVLEQARRADPYFDEQLLLDASQLICLILFAAISTGDEDAIRRLAAPSFWSTFFGRYTRNAARSARLQRAQEQGRRAGSRRQARLPVDYQALAPELISLDLRQQRACIRVSFSQLRAVVAPTAQSQTAAASAQPVVARGIVRRGRWPADGQFRARPVVAVLGRNVRPRLHPAARCEDRPPGGDRQPDLLPLRGDLPVRTGHHLRALPRRTAGRLGHVAAGGGRHR
jgi:hypothetical protein